MLDNSIEMIDQEKYTFRPIEKKVETVGNKINLAINLKQNVHWNEDQIEDFGDSS